MIGCGTRSTPFWVHRNLFWQLSRDGNLHGLGMLHARTTSPKPSFRAPLRVGNTVVGKGYAGWTTSKSGCPCSCQSSSQWPPAEKTGTGSLLNCPSCPRPLPSPKHLHDNPINQGTELNWLIPNACYCQAITTLCGSLTFQSKKTDVVPSLITSKYEVTRVPVYASNVTRASIPTCDIMKSS